ncbi:AraC family transcriptional regulator [Flavobacterium araucananum]|jgi:AraC-like DNA-binding protein|uniref:AraC family transcriptional regulator n=1 Tax=Flavobacterium araucananum TaxID=946678 RepID=A0A227PGL3_9FLAO|nr:helix-turn-helix domain-containing protein [Flavobacterium araucananum]OXG09027.1 AraC family transcriptional regulator [Flavobacterium araucananum]PWJ99785.1 AraC family transcriptional regulator [Flavobacterium araucananum]
MLSFKTHHQEFDSPEALQDAIKCFWYDRIEYGVQQSSFEVVPDGYAEIIFYFGSNLSISHNGNLQHLPSPFIMGLLNQPVVLHAEKAIEIIAVRCFPWTVFDLLGLPSGKDGVQIFEHPVAQLHPKLKELILAKKTEEAIDTVKEYFANARSKIAPNSLLFKAGVAMRQANGAMPVSQVAAAAHATVRTLERNFKQSSGYSVKDVSGLIRFEQVRNQLWHNPDCNIAALAQELGYTDQSHLSREFKRYTGTTPAAFARKARKDAVKTDFVAFIQS